MDVPQAILPCASMTTIPGKNTVYNRVYIHIPGDGFVLSCRAYSIIHDVCMSTPTNSVVVTPVYRWTLKPAHEREESLTIVIGKAT